MADANDSRFATLWLRLVRLYTFNFPIDKGKGRIFKFAKRFCRELPGIASVLTRDGRHIRVGFRDWCDDLIYFLGDYEAFCTEIIRQYIAKDSVCVDAGANIGWFTTLFQSVCGKEGEVHAFEPVPMMFEELEKNVALNAYSENVYLNNLGLGDEIGDHEMYLFADVPSGHSSLSVGNNSISATFRVKIITLDSYISERETGDIDLVKVDIEGAELMFLKGAVRLFEQKTPPVMLMEMARETCKAFGNKPNDLIKFISSKADYDFFLLDERLQRLRPIEWFDEESPGANVLCVPKGFSPRK
ncbi:MAG: FkbM family methyltransferase [Acidobacteriota bacterium]